MKYKRNYEYFFQKLSQSLEKSKQPPWDLDPQVENHCPK